MPITYSVPAYTTFMAHRHGLILFMAAPPLARTQSATPVNPFIPPNAQDFTDDLAGLTPEQLQRLEGAVQEFAASHDVVGQVSARGGGGGRGDRYGHWYWMAGVEVGGGWGMRSACVAGAEERIWTIG